MTAPEPPARPGFDRTMIGSKTSSIEHAYAWKDLVLYALAIGARATELDYLYEQRGPRSFPGFALAPALDPVVSLLNRCSRSNPRRVHAGQSIRVHDAVPPGGSLLVDATLAAIHDLGEHATVVVHSRSLDARTGACLVEGDWTFLFPGAGGFGGEPPPVDATRESPSRDPDARVTQATTPEQALLYRLASNDLHPQHVESSIAHARGFARPVLHALCVFGFMMRAFLDHAADGDARRLASMSAQFRRPTFPGDELTTELWRDSPWRLQVRSNRQEEPVIRGATASLKDV